MDRGPKPPSATAETDATRPTARRSRSARRVGYALTAGVNLIAWWITLNLLDWGWPSFLTGAFEDLSALIGFSLAATAVMNLTWMAHDPPRFKHTAQIALNVVSMAVTIRTWQVFPFDFSTFSYDWTVVVRLAIGASMLGLIVASVSELVKVVPLAGDDERKGDGDG